MLGYVQTVDHNSRDRDNLTMSDFFLLDLQLTEQSCIHIRGRIFMLYVVMLANCSVWFRAYFFDLREGHDQYILF